MVYVDKPKPSKAYVSFYILVLGYCVLPPLIRLGLLVYISLELNSSPMVIIYFILFCFLGIFITGIIFHTLYNTVYRIENGKLWMKLGYIRKGSVSLDEIKSIEIVEFNIFRFSLNFYCNRFKNGIRIITEKRKIWVSPEDSERFVSELGLKTGR